MIDGPAHCSETIVLQQCVHSYTGTIWCEQMDYQLSARRCNYYSVVCSTGVELVCVSRWFISSLQGDVIITASYAVMDVTSSCKQMPPSKCLFVVFLTFTNDKMFFVNINLVSFPYGSVSIKEKLSRLFTFCFSLLSP